MSSRSQLKAAVSAAAYYTGLSKGFALRYRGRGAILALHSVVEDGAFYPDETLRCPVSQLEWALQWLSAQGFEFVSLDCLVERLHDESAERMVAFTFDDGFADNLTLALPVMERFGAPFTVFVTTGFIARQIDAWWFGLAALVRTK